MNASGVVVLVDVERKLVTIIPATDAEWNLVLGQPDRRFKDVLGAVTGTWQHGRVDSIDKTQWVR